ncbi:MAG: hypothetical protein NTW87_14330 [Planctomycetota bacterium]|nr:hypothetical protein [Planctomycetota bacterium]
MFDQAYRYKFADWVDLRDAGDTLVLSILAAKGLFGATRVRLDFACETDEAIRVIVVDASTDVGQAVNAIFTAFILREFGSGRVHVRRVEGLCACGSQEGRQ